MSNSERGNPVEVVHGGEIRLRTPGIELIPQKVWEILSGITEDYSEFSIPDVRDDKQDQTFKLSAKTSGGKEKDIVIIRSNIIAIATLDSYEDKVWEKRYLDILSRISKTLNVVPLIIVDVDSTLIVDWKTRINHNSIIKNTLLQENLFGPGFSTMKLLSLELKSVFDVDSTDEIVCRITVDSDAGFEQNKVDIYTDPLLLRVNCGVAKRANFAPQTSIDDVLKKVYSNSKIIFDGQLKEGVIQPISSFISENE